MMKASNSVVWFASVATLALLACSSYLSRCDADELLQAPNGMPKYRLSNFRVEDDDFGRTNIVADFERTSKGDGSPLVQIAARSAEGELQVFGFPVGWQESGEIRLAKMVGLSGKGYDYELFLVANAHWAGESFGRCMVSNSVRMGNPGKSVRTRPLNAKELAAFEKDKLANVPPTSIPEGFVAVTLATKLVPGMMVMTGKFGEWAEAELMGFTEEGEAQLRFVGSKRVFRRPKEEWLAVDPEVLKQSEVNPSQFEPSGLVLNDGSYAIPDDATPLTESVTLVPGTPLLYERAGKWQIAYVLKEKGGQIRVHYDNMDSAFDEEKPRGHFAVRKSTLDRLALPSAAEEFASNVEPGSGFGGAEKNDFAERHRRDRHKFRHTYRITEPIPREAQLLPKDLVVPKGTTLAVCHGFEWKRVSVVEDNGDGTVAIDWYDRAPAWDGDVARDELIIENKTLRKLKRLAAPQSSQQAGEFRIWRDASGEYEIEATLLRHSESTVTLKTKEGREKTLEITRLSEADQEFVSNLNLDSKNPFAP